jgi:hypothetical protein
MSCSIFTGVFSDPPSPISSDGGGVNLANYYTIDQANARYALADHTHAEYLTVGDLANYATLDQLPDITNNITDTELTTILSDYQLVTDAFSGAYGDLTGKPDLLTLLGNYHPKGEQLFLQGGIHTEREPVLYITGSSATNQEAIRINGNFQWPVRIYNGAGQYNFEIANNGSFFSRGNYNGYGDVVATGKGKFGNNLEVDGLIRVTNTSSLISLTPPVLTPATAETTNYILPHDGNNGQILTTNGSGGLYWSDPATNVGGGGGEFDASLYYDKNASDLRFAIFSSSAFNSTTDSLSNINLNYLSSLSAGAYSLAVNDDNNSGIGLYSENASTVLVGMKRNAVSNNFALKLWKQDNGLDLDSVLRVDWGGNIEVTGKLYFRNGQGLEGNNDPIPNVAGGFILSGGGNYQFTFPNSSGTSGQVLTTDGNGLTSWTDKDGGGGGATFDINALTAITDIVDTDTLGLYDASATEHKKITYASFYQNVKGDLQADNTFDYLTETEGDNRYYQKITDGTDGQVLTTDGAGGIAWETVQAGNSSGYWDGIVRNPSTIIATIRTNLLETPTLTAGTYEIEITSFLDNSGQPDNAMYTGFKIRNDNGTPFSTGNLTKLYGQSQRFVNTGTTNIMFSDINISTGGQYEHQYGWGHNTLQGSSQSYKIIIQTTADFKITMFASMVVGTATFRYRDNSFIKYKRID